MQNYFSQLISPMVRPGKDGGLDGKLEMLPINYSDLLNKPFEFKSPDGKESLWVFQCKFTQIGGDDEREQAVLTSLASEIEGWKKRDKKLTHFIFFTNVNLRPTALEAVEKMGREGFPYFEVWHEPKISGFIANSVALQKTFYPTRVTSLNFASVDLRALIASPASQPAGAMVQGQPKTSPAKEPAEAIRLLAEYEISFLQVNNEFLEKLKVSNDQKSLPENWKKHTHKSKCKGLLGLSSDLSSLQWLIDKITLNDVSINFWHRFLGEQTEPEDEIATLSFNPDLEADLFSHLDRIFECVQGKNEAHVEVDEFLQELESKILTDVKLNKIQSAQDGILKLLKARRDYSSFKKSNPQAFYPNARRWGRVPVFGWDFMDLWEKVLKNICDIVFSGNYPKSVSDLLISVPFHLCIEAIRAKQPKESFQAELFTLRIVFWNVIENSDKSYADNFLDNLEDLAQEINDADHRIESVEDAEWALGISKEVAEYIGNLGYLALSGKASLPFDKLINLLSLATSLHFMDLLSGSVATGGNWLEVHETQKNLDRKLSLIRKEYLYAWATYSWYQERHSPTQDPTFAISLLRHLEMSEVVHFYSQRRFGESNWFNSWFRPEGKRVSWSTSVDHDVRDTLQLAILTLPLKKEDFEPLDMFEVKSLFDAFLNEVSELHARLTTKGIIVSDLQKVKSILNEAMSYHDEKLKNLLRNQKSLSEKKLAEITASFQKSLAQHNQEGSLYNIEETLGDRAPAHYVGPYFITEKAWYLDNTGSSSYSVTGLGSGWAENVIAGRAHLVVETAKEKASIVSYSGDELLKTLEQIRDSHDDKYILITAHMTIPWEISSDLLTNEYEIKSSGEQRVPGRSGRLGKVDVYYSRFLKRGEILVVPKLALTWVIKEKIRAPRVSLIDENSEEAKQLKQKNPDLDLGLKALVYAREEGVMTYDDAAGPPIYYQRASDSKGTEEEETEAE